MFTRLMNIVTFSVAVLWVSFYSYSMFMANMEPLVIHSSQAENSIIKYGNPLLLTASLTRKILCPSESHRFVTDESGYVVYRAINPAAASRLGTYTIRVAVHLPPNLTRGKYKYNAIVYSICDNRTYTTIGPTIEFEII